MHRLFDGRPARVLVLILAVLGGARRAVASDGRGLQLAVLPIDNATGVLAPVDNLERLLVEDLHGRGLVVASRERVDGFLEQRRIRYTGGLSFEVLRAMGEDLGVDAVLVTSEDLWVEEAPPRLGLNGRVVRARDGAILWAAEIALAGEDRPGILGLGVISDPKALATAAVRRLAESLKEGLLRAADVVEGTPATWPHPRPSRAFRPQKTYRAAELDAPRGRPFTVAVLPFENVGGRGEADRVIAGLFSTHLAGWDGFLVIEPGEVREVLLRNRVIQESGLSLAQADVLRLVLQSDLVVTGEVLEYEDRGPEANPSVSVAVRVIDTARREVVWSCLSSHRGDDGVTAFDRRLRTARALASEMVRGAARAFARGAAPRRGPPPTP